MADMGFITKQHLEEALARHREINKPFHAVYVLQAVTNAVKSKAG